MAQPIQTASWPEEDGPTDDFASMIRARRIHDSEGRTQKRCAKLGNQLLERIIPISEAFAECPIHAMRRTSPMHKFMQLDGVVSFRR